MSGVNGVNGMGGVGGVSESGGGVQLQAQVEAAAELAHRRSDGGERAVHCEPPRVTLREMDGGVGVGGTQRVESAAARSDERGCVGDTPTRLGPFVPIRLVRVPLLLRRGATTAAAGNTAATAAAAADKTSFHAALPPLRLGLLALPRPLPLSRHPPLLLSEPRPLLLRCLHRPPHRTMLLPPRPRLSLLHLRRRRVPPCHIS